MAYQTLLQTVVEVLGRLGQPIPSTIMGNTDKGVVQIKSLLQEGLDQLSSRAQWERLTYEYTFATIANENQGALTAGLGSPVVAPNGLRYLLPETLWDRTNKLPLVGPLDPQDWQAMKAWIINGPRYQFRQRGGNFYVNPVPTAGWTWAFEYVSENYIQAAAGTYAMRFALDTDVILLPVQFVELDLTWRWKKAKGLPYAQDFDDLEALLADAKARNQPAKVLRMDSPDCYTSPRPIIVVPGGSWNLP